MADRQLEHLLAQIAAITASLKTLALHAPDLHSVAYDRRVSGLGVGHAATLGEGGEPLGLESHGDEHARDLWRRLEKAAAHMETSARTLEWAIGNLMSKGGSPEETRGSLIQRGEHRAEIRKQQRNRERGDYTPTLMVDQPGYPGVPGR